MPRSGPHRYNKDYVTRRLRRRAWVRAVVGAVAVLLALSALLDRAGTFGFGGDDWAAFDRETYTVRRVIDGDTVVIARGAVGEETRVRLLGIDAAEMNFESGKPPAYWAEQSTAYLKERCEGRNVIVQLEPTQTRDRHGRLLAYLHLSDIENLNLLLVRDGQVYADRRFDHSLETMFVQAESEARQKRRGLWKGIGDEQMPAWRQRWLQSGKGGARSESD